MHDPISDHPDPLPDVPHEVNKLGCYSALYSTTALVFHPTCEDHLHEIFKYAKEHDCRVTLRGGAHSFDEQSLGDDIVVSMMGFDDVQVSPQAKRLTVGPGATWGHILEALESFGLMPAVTVTTSHATAGGTLAGDCLSRFSPAYGKEGTRVESFDLVTPEGKRLVCTPPKKGDPPSKWTPEQHAFSGVIGGLGYLGAVVAITYRVLTVNDAPPIRMATRIKKYKSLESFEGMAKELMEVTARTDAELSDPNDATKLDSIYAGLYAGRRGRKSALLFTSKVVTGRKLNRLLLHRPRNLLRVLAEWLLRSWVAGAILWRVFYFFTKDDEDYVDNLADYTFFMDGNLRAKRIGQKWFKRKMQTIQQTFVVPPGTKGGWCNTKEDLAEWLDYTHDYMRKKKITPTMHDVMYLPADERFPLSATAELAGFAVSYAFETSSKRKLARIRASFEELSDVLWAKFEGRVYLVKNVHAKRETLRNMYYPNAVEFFELKHELDPHCILRNRFLDRTFKELLVCTPLPTPAAPVSGKTVASPIPGGTS